MKSPLAVSTPTFRDRSPLQKTFNIKDPHCANWRTASSYGLRRKKGKSWLATHGIGGGFRPLGRRLGPMRAFGAVRDRCFRPDVGSVMGSTKKIGRYIDLWTDIWSFWVAHGPCVDGTIPCGTGMVWYHTILTRLVSNKTFMQQFRNWLAVL